MNTNEKTTFIKVDQFDSAMTALSVIRKKFSDAKVILERINGLKQEEDAALQKWSLDMQSVESKIDNIESELASEE